MPAYGTPQAGGVPTALDSEDVMFLWANETPANGTASIPFARSGKQPGGGTFQAFGPGTVSVQIQASNVDVEADYVNVGTAFAKTGSYTDTNNFVFYRAQVETLTGGAISVTASRP